MTGIGFGTWAWGNKLVWGYEPGEGDLILEETLQEALKGGLSLIDTADSYGTGSLNGKSEILVGKFLKNAEDQKKYPKNLIVASKLAPYPWRIGRTGFNKAFIASQKRLCGYLNRIQLHWSTYRYAPWQEELLLDNLGDLIESGEIKELGVSNVGPLRLQWMNEKMNKRGIKIKSLQVQLSLLAPQSICMENIGNICKDLGIELIAYSPLAFGILCYPPNKNTIGKTTFLRRNLFKRLLPASKTLREVINQIANNRNSSQSQVALNWCRSHGAIPIPGLRTPEQAKQAVAALKWDLNNEEKERLDKVSLSCKKLMPRNPFQSN